MSDRKPFKSGCPCPGCPNQDTMIRWVHSDCGGYRWIYDDGYLQCEKCNKRNKLIDNSFSCQYHKGEYREMSLGNILKAISISSSINGWGKDFTFRLCNSITNMYDYD